MLALHGIEKVGTTLGETLRLVLDFLIKHLLAELPETINWEDRMAVYENRDLLYLTILEHRTKCFELLHSSLETLLPNCDMNLIDHLQKTLMIDEMFCPRSGQQHNLDIRFVSSRSAL